MNLLLDTHTFLWLLSDIKKLPPNVVELCKDPDNALYLSVVNSWEIQIKAQKGKLALPVSRKELIQNSLAHGLIMLPVKGEHIDALDDIADHHADPFDRLLIAQAITENLTLLSVDEKIHLYEEVNVLWNQHS